jgi:glucokinase
LKLAALVQCAIGIDVGGTKIAAGLVLTDGTILQQKRIATQAHLGGEYVLQMVTELAEHFLQEAKVLHSHVSGIGVGVAELVDAQGQVTSSQTIKWQNLDVQKHLSRLAPSKVESDVRAAALAESLFGAGKGLEHFIYITVGTGISHTLVINGKPLAGAHGNALVFASSPMTLWDEVGKKEYIPLENFSAGPALVRRYNQRTGKTLVQGQEVFEAAKRGDREAVYVLESAANNLGAGIGWLVNVFDPQAVVVGGGLGVAGGLYWEKLERSAREHIWSEQSRRVSMLKAALDVDGGLVGAASLMFDNKFLAK